MGFRWALIVMFTPLLTSCGSAPSSAPPSPSLLRGRILAATPPGRKMNSEGLGFPVCSQAHPDGMPDESLRGWNGGLANVLVYLRKAPPSFVAEPRSAEPALLDQSGCLFIPHVLGLRAGQRLRIRNSDPMLHALAFQGPGRSPASFSLARQGEEKEMDLGQAGSAWTLACPVHPWMKAYVRVFDHPYFAVSDAEGNFEIKGLPPGRQELEAWHEKLGMKETAVEIPAGKDGSVTIQY